MDNLKLSLTQDKFQEMVLDLLIDILAENRDIKDRLDATYDYSFDANMKTSREIVLEYLYTKYGEPSKSLKDFLGNEGIESGDK